MSETIGRCYRYPPALIPNCEMSEMSAPEPWEICLLEGQTRPTVKKDDFCGEYKQKPLKVNDGWCKSCIYFNLNKKKDADVSGKEGADDNDSL